MFINKRGRPRKDKLQRERASFTLNPKAREKLLHQSNELGISQSDFLNKIILEEVLVAKQKNYKDPLSRVAIPTLKTKLFNFCRKYKIKNLSFFGSILNDNFNAESDVDVLAEFDTESKFTLLNQIQMENELASLFDRKVDLVSRSALEKSDNWLKKKHILDSAVTIYAA